MTGPNEASSAAWSAEGSMPVAAPGWGQLLQPASWHGGGGYGGYGPGAYGQGWAGGYPGPGMGGGKGKGAWGKGGGGYGDWGGKGGLRRPRHDEGDGYRAKRQRVDTAEPEIQVSGSGDPGKVAGYLTHLFEDGNRKVVLTSVGTKSIGVALKAMALSRAMSQSKGLDVEFEVVPSSFRPESDVWWEEGQQRNAPAIRFEVIIHNNDESGWQEIMEEDERDDYISCAANTLEGKLAGSLAIRLQQDDRVRLKSMGNEPGIQAARALALAQRYVFKDTNGQSEIFFLPRRVLGLVVGKVAQADSTGEGCSDPWCCPQCNRHNKPAHLTCQKCGTEVPATSMFIGWDWKIVKRPCKR
eukprot:GGOE01061687.1.p1 GENE.GGOE01061687.1~~GGOE01061687.1.p1  ORF type:complete len:400 (+),score=80.21 GGOE01061687.1:137-1201(+)